MARWHDGTMARWHDEDCFLKIFVTLVPSCLSAVVP
jgi:hypothetical protein